MSFKLENFGADASNVKSILGGANYYRYFNKDNNTLTTPGYFPADLGLAVGDRITVIPSVKTNPDELYVVTSTANRTVTVTQIDTDGAVDSVNGKTGHVVLGASDVGAIAQLSTLPTASADEEEKIYQFVGTTDANYTNGYFYKCVSDGQEPATYSWTQVSVQPASSGLPDQTGQSGKFLTTDGTDASWGSISALQNTATGSSSLTVSGTAATIQYSTNAGINSSVGSAGSSNTAYGYNCIITGFQDVALGYNCSVTTNTSGSGNGHSLAVGSSAKVQNANYAIQIGTGTNNDSNTLKIGNFNGNFELMDANGNIPAARLASTTGLADGNYKLRLTISGGVATLSFVAE